MKILLTLLGIVFSFSVPNYSKNTTHYVVLSAGGVFNAGNLKPKQEVQQEYHSSFIGGGFLLEAGYLAVLSNKNILHGFDTRLSFGITYNTLNKPINPNKPNLTQLIFSINNTYQIGNYTKSGKLLFDIIGIGLGFSCTTLYGYSSNINQTDILELNSFLLSVHLPLLFQYISNNGFMFGIRHRLNILFTQNDLFGHSSKQISYIEYSINISLGVALVGKPSATGTNYTDRHRFEVEYLY